MSDQDLICVCMTVSRGEIKNAIHQGGCRTVDALKNTLFCCTGCGTCEPKVRKILEDELAAAKTDAEPASKAG